MKKIIVTTAGLMAGTVLMLASSSAMAHGHVDWSVSIGAPIVPIYAAPAPMYAPPPVVYQEPVVVYQEPIVRYRPQPYYTYPAYGYRDPYWRRHEWRAHGWERGHHDGYHERDHGDHGRR